MSHTKIYDAIVIGSGITGGWAAKELTEKGLDVLQLEAGRKIEPKTDYTEHKLPYELKFRGMVDQRFIEENHPIQKESDGSHLRFRSQWSLPWAEGI